MPPRPISDAMIRAVLDNWLNPRAIRQIVGDHHADQMDRIGLEARKLLKQQ